MITKKHIKEFNNNGILVIKNFIKQKQIKRVLKHMDFVLNTILEYNKINFKKNSSIEQKYFLLKKKKPKLKSHFYDSIRILDSFNDIIYSKNLTDTIKKLLNTNAVFVTNHRLRSDHKTERANLALHQELNNISTESALIFCPFVKVNQKTGGICAIPKSHKFDHLIYKDSHIAVGPNHKTGVVDKILKGKKKVDYGNKIVNELFNKKNIYFPNLNPGDGLIFKNFIFHGSTQYKGKGLRWAVIGNYHKVQKTPYILKEDFKACKKLELGLPMRIRFKDNLNKILN